MFGCMMTSIEMRRSWEIECELVTPQQIKKLCPLVDINDIKGGLWIPKDGTADPYKICLALIEIAKSKGKEIVNKLLVYS